MVGGRAVQARVSDAMSAGLSTEAKYLAALATIVRETPLATIKDALTLQLLWSHRIYLDDEIQTISFDFRGRVLAGTEQLPPIEERVLQDVNDWMGEALGQLYVAAHFPPEAKAEIEALVQELIAAFKARLEQNPWLSATAKAEALDKLSKMIVKVGYPDTWRSYDEVAIQDSYAGSVRSALRADYWRMLARVGEPVDKTEWFVPPQVVNAFYDPADNSINFPAGILQPPFFDYQGDAAANFGAIGFVIGHEITHGYDLQGSQFDADGNLNDWYTLQDHERFDALNQRVVEQYGAVEVLPGLFVDGQITVTENVADLGGLQMAYDALQNSLYGQGVAATPGASPIADVLASPIATPIGSPMASPVAVVDLADLTPEQRFFISAATVWRGKIRDEFMTTLVKTDVHAPVQVRATLPLENMDAYIEAFNIQPGDPMYLPPEERVVVW